MLPVTDFLAELPDDERRALVNAIGHGLHYVLRAADSLSEAEPGVQTTADLLACLSSAIRELGAARDLIRHRA